MPLTCHLPPPTLHFLSCVCVRLSPTQPSQGPELGITFPQHTSCQYYCVVQISVCSLYLLFLSPRFLSL